MARRAVVGKLWDRYPAVEKISIHLIVFNRLEDSLLFQYGRVAFAEALILASDFENGGLGRNSGIEFDAIQTPLDLLMPSGRLMAFVFTS